MYGYIYKVVILDESSSINKSYYIGQKKGTVERTRGYYGSGYFIRKYIKKHGTNFLKKEILKDDIHNSDDLDYFEKEFIGELFKTDPWCLNLKGGGRSGKLNDYLKQKMSGENNPNYGHKWTDEQRKQASDYRKKHPITRSYRPFTNEEKEKMSTSLKKSKKHRDIMNSSNFIKERTESLKLYYDNLTKEEKNKIYGLSGSLNNNYGNKLSKEQKQKISKDKISKNYKNIDVLDVKTGITKKYVDWVLLIGGLNLHKVFKQDYLNIKGNILTIRNKTLSVEENIKYIKNIIDVDTSKRNKILVMACKNNAEKKKLKSKYYNINLVDLDTGETNSFYEWEIILGEKPYSIVNNKCKTIKGRKLKVIK